MTAENLEHFTKAVQQLLERGQLNSAVAVLEAASDEARLAALDAIVSILVLNPNPRLAWAHNFICDLDRPTVLERIENAIWPNLQDHPDDYEWGIVLCERLEYHQLAAKIATKAKNKKDIDVCAVGNRYFAAKTAARKSRVAPKFRSQALIYAGRPEIRIFCTPADDGGYVAACPEDPRIFSQGETLDECVANILEVRTLLKERQRAKP